MGNAEHWMAWPLACLSKSSPVPECLLVGAGFSPRVALLEDALLMETSMVQRLWGGREVLLARLDSAFAQACQAVSGLPGPGAAMRMAAAVRTGQHGLAGFGTAAAAAGPAWRLRPCFLHA
jgi:protein ImuB